jgi:hypothetical protein
MLMPMNADDGRSRRLDTASLIKAQIKAGEALRRAIRRAAATADLELLEPELAAWSAGNERVLAEVFGEAERRAYRRTTAARGAVTGTFSDARIRTERTTDSRLRYLQAAVVRIDLAQELGGGRRTLGWLRGVARGVPGRCVRHVAEMRLLGAPQRTAGACRGGGRQLAGRVLADR